MVNVTSSTLVETLKDLIKDIEGTPADQQRLVLGFETLEDSKTMDVYKITKVSSSGVS